MTEILRYSNLESPRDILDENGDVKPYGEEYDESADALQTALEERDEAYLEELAESQQPSSPAIPAEVLEVVHEAAIEEDTYRAFGATTTRIARVVHTPLARELAKLQARGVDTSGAIQEPPKPTSYPGTGAVVEKPWEGQDWGNRAGGDYRD